MPGSTLATNVKASPKRIAELERAAAALELRKRGKSFDEIAELCGYSNRSGAYLVITRSLQRAIQEPAEAVLQLELNRLDALLDGIWDQAVGTQAYTTSVSTIIDGVVVPPGTLVPAQAGSDKAVGAALKIMERRARLLGLDKPQERKVQTTITEVPSPPPDLVDYQTKLLAALSIAGALHLELPEGLEPLNKPGDLLPDGLIEIIPEPVTGLGAPLGPDDYNPEDS